ncbi:peptidase_S9 domain-containing protein, partial [Haematococcus lacustris]
VRELAALPLAESIPIAFNSVRQGPRSVDWRSDKPAELCWIEAQDGGDAGVEVSPRDLLRCGGVAWCDDDLAIVYEDGGDAGVEVSPRDLVFTLDAHQALDAAPTAAAAAAAAASTGLGPGAAPNPEASSGLASGPAATAGQPRQLAATQLRCGGVAWCDDDLAIVYEAAFQKVRLKQLYRLGQPSALPFF